MARHWQAFNTKTDGSADLTEGSTYGSFHFLQRLPCLSTDVEYRKTQSDSVMLRHMMGEGTTKWAPWTRAYEVGLNRFYTSSTEQWYSDPASWNPEYMITSIDALERATFGIKGAVATIRLPPGQK